MPILTRSRNVVFTPEARALLGPMASWSSNSDAASFPDSCSNGDLVHIEGCSATFQVVGKTWTLGAQSETLDVLLDVFERAPALRPV